MRKRESKLQKLIIDNQVVTDEKEISNDLNNYFCSPIPSTTKHFASYLRNKVHETFFGKDEIPKVTQFKYIGLTLDENLTWEPHINKICSVLVRYYSIFYNIRNSITSNIPRAIYYACIYPHISYAIKIYGSANSTLISKLQVQQNKLLKLLTKRDYKYSTDRLQQENHILKEKHIHELYTLAFVFCSHKDTPIEPFKDYFKRRSKTHEYELRNNENLSTNKICRNTGKTTTHTTSALLLFGIIVLQI